MAKRDRPAGGLARWLRWAGRILGTCSGAFWLFMGIVSAVAGQDPWTGESTMLAILIAAAAAGAGIAWWREDIGGTSGMAFSATWQPGTTAMSQC